MVMLYFKKHESKCCNRFDEKSVKNLPVYMTIFVCLLSVDIVHGICFSDVLFFLFLAGVYVATSLLQQRANDVRANRVNWQSYLQ